MPKNPPQKENYRITLIRPEGVSVNEMRDYIIAAVSYYCKASPPDRGIGKVTSLDSIAVTRIIAR